MFKTALVVCALCVAAASGTALWAKASSQAQKLAGSPAFEVSMPPIADILSKAGPLQDQTIHEAF